MVRPTQPECVADFVTPVSVHQREEMSWKMDGRHGDAMQGDARRKGFALLRDQGRQLIVFQVLPDDPSAWCPAGPSPRDHFVIGDGDFEPTAA